MSDTNTPPTNARGDRPWRRRSELWGRESQIRQLSDAGWSAAQIQRLLGLRVSESRLRQFIRGRRRGAAPAPAVTALSSALQSWRHASPTTPMEFAAEWFATLPSAVRAEIRRASPAALTRLVRALTETYPALSAGEWGSVLVHRTPARGTRRSAGKGAAPASPEDARVVTQPSRVKPEVACSSTSNLITQALDAAEGGKPDFTRFFRKE